MKKTAMIHSVLSRLVAELGHLDEIVVCDSGFPIPPDKERIDLALTPGVPGFIQTLNVLMEELCVQEIRVAEEMVNEQPELYQELRRMFADLPMQVTSHADFKTHSHQAARAFIRTGEFTPYANVALVSGVVF